jgi:hypothetical protein
MNSSTTSILSARFAGAIVALCAGIFLVSSAPAQPAANPVSGRFLLVFDTSSAMKKREPATQYAIERLFFAVMNGQLHPGDTIGVWAFDRKLRVGEFPLKHWQPQDAATIASDITNFVGQQRYSRSTRFDVLVPELNRLVQNSERLTVLIFCDGEGEIKGTPFDQPINGAFQQYGRELGKANQAFIIVLRSQFGRYTGYSVNFSSAGVNFPVFPPLPAPPQSAPPPQTNPPPVQVEANPPPVVQMPPLVIIGTNVGTNLLPSAPPKMAQTNLPPIKVESNPPPAVALVTNSTNAVPPSMAKAQTNTAAPAEENPSGLSRNGALAIGAVLLAVAVVFLIFVLIRSRKTGRGSLISRAMKKD